MGVLAEERVMEGQAWLQYGSFGLLAAGLVWASRVASKVIDRALGGLDRALSGVGNLSESMDKLATALTLAVADSERRNGTTQNLIRDSTLQVLRMLDRREEP
jgi:hypothetical protein